MCIYYICNYKPAESTVAYRPLGGACTEEGPSPSGKASTSGGDRVLHFWKIF